MKKRFFYLEDINTVETVETITKKELLSIAEGLKSFTFSEHDDVISGYTKDGKFFYYDCTNFWNFKKSDIINAISVVYSSDSGYYVYGDYTVNMYGVVNPTEDGETLIWTGGNIKEVESADYSETEEETAEEPAADQEPEEETTENYVAWCGMIENDVITDEFETLSEAVDEVETRYNKDEMKAAGITFCKLLCNSGQWLECLEEKQVDDVFYGPFKKLYDVFHTFSARGLDIYSHKPERWSRNRPPVIALETEEAIYYCDERDKNNVVRFLNRNSARANTK